MFLLEYKNQDFCSGAFEQHMAGGGDPMDAFDAVGSSFDGSFP